MSQYQENATVSRVERLSDTNVRLTLQAPKICSSAEPGQFVMIRVGVSKDPLLRRPFCIHQVRDDGMLQVYYKIVGKGTEILSSLKEGEQVSVLGPLGRGFDLTPSGQRILVGGGLGIASFLEAGMPLKLLPL
ncbi:MAG: hypothetical protein CR992_01190 [Desulfobacterales bacterium]|nr:MAG: hypothetical protein CR992_01190 [Desulfobacterales bacterium]